MNKVEIPIGDKYKLVAEFCGGSEFPGISIGVYNSNDVWYQDLVVVEQHFTEIDPQTWLPIYGNHPKFNVFVYGNENMDDFTSKHVIRMVNEDEDR